MASRPGEMASGIRTNRIIAANLSELADLLEQQGADSFRVAAYRNAAASVIEINSPLAGILEEGGLDGLVALPAIGKSIAGAIAEMLRTGRWAQLERLRGTVDPEELFCTVPGIGPGLAARLHGELHIDTLEALEIAAHDGSLNNVPGFGPRRVAMVRASLQERLGRRRFRAVPKSGRPAVDLLLDVDREYREGAQRDLLKKIAPKRFNPRGIAWLPVLHTKRGEWLLSALFSNTYRAHELGRTRDWVVIYYHSDGETDGQCTVVTETIGAWLGKRVVRGREAECAAFYRHVAKSA